VELPLAIETRPANAVDMVMAPTLMENIEAGLKGMDWKPRPMVMDKGFDAEPIYRMVTTLGSTPIIPLHSNTKTLASDGEQNFADDGTPLCPGKAKMKRHGRSRNKAAVVFHCPAKYAGHQNGKLVRKVDLGRCPLRTLCEPESKMGPTVFVSMSDNPRLHGPVARESQTWKELYKKRSGAERLYSTFKSEGPQGAVKRQEYVLINLVGQSIVRHAKVWVKEEFAGEMPNTMESLLRTLEKIASQGEEPHPLAS
jgi:hypothetical protein